MSFEENNAQLAQLYRELEQTPLRDPELIDSFLAFLHRQATIQPTFSADIANEELIMHQFDGMAFSQRMVASMHEQLIEHRESLLQTGITHGSLVELGSRITGTESRSQSKLTALHGALDPGGDLHNLLALHVAMQEGRAEEYVNLMANQQALSVQASPMGIPALILHARQRSEETPITSYYTAAHGFETKVLLKMEEILDGQLTVSAANTLGIDPMTEVKQERVRLEGEVKKRKTELLKYTADTYGFKYNPIQSVRSAAGGENLLDL